MSQENVDVVRAIYDAWGRGDYPGPADLLDPEVEYVNPEGAIEPGTRVGIQAFQRAVERTLEAWEFWQIEPEEFRAVGSRVVAIVRYAARGRGSGVDVQGRESALWTLRDKRIVRYQWFHEPGDALEAVRLSE